MPIWWPLLAKRAATAWRIPCATSRRTSATTARSGGWCCWRMRRARSPGSSGIRAILSVRCGRAGCRSARRPTSSHRPEARERSTTMPILNDASMQGQTLPTGHYGYSATRIDRLGATEYTLVTIVNDVSGSVAAFRNEMEEALKEIVRACKFSPRADNLMVRLVTFSDALEEKHGFKLLQQCALRDYHRALKGSGNTALYDATENAMMATTSYGKQLTDADYGVNAILFVITDGMDNASKRGVRQVREAFQKAVASEALESVVSILIGVNVQDSQVGPYLQDFKNEAGFTQYVEIGAANAQTLAKLAEFVSRSISAQSQALGSGGSSTSLVF